MKKIINILWIAVAVIALSACAREEAEIGGPPNTYMEVISVVGGAETEDYIHSVRYFIFDNASSYPILDVNKRLPVEQEHQDAKEFKCTLKVSQNRDKMVVMIVNEPSYLSEYLDGITLPEGLEDITFQMAKVFNENSTALLENGIPMTGVLRGVSVGDSNDSEDNAAQVKIHVERVVARVDLWLAKDAAITSAEVNTSTKVTLFQSHDKGYLVAGTAEDKTRYQEGAAIANNFGHMMEVINPSETYIWESSASVSLNATSQLICSFYVPERTCFALMDDDKLVLRIEGVNSSAGVRGGEVVLASFYPAGGGVEKPLEIIMRNNVYQIFGTVKENRIESECYLSPWKDIGQSIIIDPEYYLNVSTDEVYMFGAGDLYTMKAETNYNQEDWGFPKGIQIDRSNIKYFNKYGVQVSSGSENGWLVLFTSPSDEGLTMNITLISIDTGVTASQEGCYAVFEVKAGNITKKIKVLRYLKASEKI